MTVSTWNNVTSIEFHATASSITCTTESLKKIKQHHCQPPTHSSSFKAPFQQDSAHCLQFCAMPANSEIIKICRISLHQTRTDTTGDYKYSLCGESVKLRGSFCRKVTFRGQLIADGRSFLSDYFERSADHGPIVHSLLFARENHLPSSKIRWLSAISPVKQLACPCVPNERI